MHYRRATTPAGTYFFTLNLANRKKTLLIDYIDSLRKSVNNVKQRHPFKLDAMVILPDHLHAMITLPPDDNDYATRWMLIKQGFSRQIPKTEPISNSRKTKEERGIWQRRYWEHVIRDQEDYKNHYDYIHYNPVKHGYVSKAIEWKYSTLHHEIKKGNLPPNWGNEENDRHEKNYGERK